MLDRRLRSFSSLSPKDETWLDRVRENLAQLLMPVRLRQSSANGAPLHLLDAKRTTRAGQAQSFSLLIHVVTIGVLVACTAARPPSLTPDSSGETPRERILAPPPGFLSFLGNQPPSSGKLGGSGGHDPRPATRGNFAPFSSISFVRPHLPSSANPRLPINASIPDPEAPALVNPPYVKLGLPWMKDDNGSPGPGCCKGIGSSQGGYMGDEDGPGAGVGKEGRFVPGMKMPSCVYCPNPPYTEEARKAKVQGSVTLEVLIGANGQALKIRIVRGVGFGLDERAMQTVQGWRFIPARDPAGRAVSVWVPVEVAFRLF